MHARREGIQVRSRTRAYSPSDEAEYRISRATGRLSTVDSAARLGSWAASRSRTRLPRDGAFGTEVRDACVYRQQAAKRGLQLATLTLQLFYDQSYKA